MRTRYLGLVTIAAVCLSVTAWLQGASKDSDSNKAELERQLHDALQARVETAQAVMDAVQASYEAQTVTFHQVVVAARDLIEAKLDACKNVDEEIALLQKQLDVMKANEARVEQLYNLGTRGGEARDYFTAKRERQTAEIELLKARIKAKH